VKEYEENQRTRAAVKGFISLYCRGKKMDDCVRKKVSRELGGPEFVPENMMPNGLPVIGTTRDTWDKAIFDIILK